MLRLIKSNMKIDKSSQIVSDVIVWVKRYKNRFKMSPPIPSKYPFNFTHYYKLHHLIYLFSDFSALTGVVCSVEYGMPYYNIVWTNSSNPQLQKELPSGNEQ